MQLPDYSKRTYGLDLYRAIAIFFVISGHGRYMLQGSFLEGFPWLRFINGVDMFFILSGFLIGTSFFKKLQKNNFKFGFKNDILPFWKRAWFRTLPNYYLFLFVNVILIKFAVIDGDLAHFNYKFFLFIQNFCKPFYDFFWESWSLSVQEWYYIIFPLFLFLTLKFFPSKKGILFIICILIIMPLIYRISISGETVDSFWWDVKFRKVVITRLDTIFYGVLAAYIKVFASKFWKKFAIPALIIGLIICLLVPQIPTQPNDFYRKTFYFAIFAIGGILLLPFFDSIRNFRTPVGKFVTHISLISYAMYLTNSIIIALINKHFPVANPTDGVIKYFIYWIIVLASSALVYHFFETLITNLRNKNFNLIKIRKKNHNE